MEGDGAWERGAAVDIRVSALNALFAGVVCTTQVTSCPELLRVGPITLSHRSWVKYCYILI